MRAVCVCRYRRDSGHEWHHPSGLRGAERQRESQAFDALGVHPLQHPPGRLMGAVLSSRLEEIFPADETGELMWPSFWPAKKPELSLDELMESLKTQQLQGITLRDGGRSEGPASSRSAGPAGEGALPPSSRELAFPSKGWVVEGGHPGSKGSWRLRGNLGSTLWRLAKDSMEYGDGRAEGRIYHISVGGARVGVAQPEELPVDPRPPPCGPLPSRMPAMDYPLPEWAGGPKQCGPDPYIRYPQKRPTRSSPSWSAAPGENEIMDDAQSRGPPPPDHSERSWGHAGASLPPPVVRDSSVPEKEELEKQLRERRIQEEREHRALLARLALDPTAGDWFYHIGERERKGPFSLPELRQKLAQGELLLGMSIQRAGDRRWMLLEPEEFTASAKPAAVTDGAKDVDMEEQAIENGNRAKGPSGEAVGGGAASEDDEDWFKSMSEEVAVTEKTKGDVRMTAAMSLAELKLTMAEVRGKLHHKVLSRCVAWFLEKAIAEYLRAMPKDLPRKPQPEAPPKEAAARLSEAGAQSPPMPLRGAAASTPPQSLTPVKKRRRTEDVVDTAAPGAEDALMEDAEGRGRVTQQPELDGPIMIKKKRPRSFAMPDESPNTPGQPVTPGGPPPPIAATPSSGRPIPTPMRTPGSGARPPAAQLPKSATRGVDSKSGGPLKGSVAPGAPGADICAHDIANAPRGLLPKGLLMKCM
ncbi:hypothetical protein CYMTET_30295, partial [Cymbomonas tetramitiformis]